MQKDIGGRDRLEKTGRWVEGIDGPLYTFYAQKPTNQKLGG